MPLVGFTKSDFSGIVRLIKPEVCYTCPLYYTRKRFSGGEGMSKDRKKKAGRSKVKLNGRRGSSVWSFNYFRSVVLTNLLNDLYNLEGTGIEDKYCQKISASLNYFSNAATNIPSAMPLMGPLYKDIEKFTELYQKWNDVQGRDLGAAILRKEIRLKLMDQRQKITDKARKLQVAIQDNVDTELMKAGFDALSELITAVPDLLGNIGKVLKEFTKRTGVL